MGPLGRYAGLGCDAVTEVEMVLSKGTGVRANSGNQAGS